MERFRFIEKVEKQFAHGAAASRHISLAAGKRGWQAAQRTRACDAMQK